MLSAAPAFAVADPAAADTIDQAVDVIATTIKVRPSVVSRPLDLLAATEYAWCSPLTIKTYAKLQGAGSIIKSGFGVAEATFKVLKEVSSQHVGCVAMHQAQQKP